MIKNKKISFVFIGFALFSMFFGSGNLIFPLYIGQIAKDQWLLASFGFLITSVLVPFLGVLAMLAFRGNYLQFFQCLGNRLGFLVMATLLTVWIPLGSAPRCITLAYSSISSYFSIGPFWIFSLLYCSIIYFIIGTKGRMLDILGYVLTPLLLFCLFMIIINGVSLETVLVAPTSDGWDHFFNGLTEGYNTMDLIASFFFSASIIEILQNAMDEKVNPLKTTFKACIIGMALLAIVYVSLITLSSSHFGLLQEIPKDQMLAYIAKHVLGTKLGMIAVIAIFLACFTTSVALVVVYADFLNKTLFKNHPTNFGAKITTLAISFTISLTGLKGITLITAPVLEIFYPFLIIMILTILGIKQVKKSSFQVTE